MEEEKNRNEENPHQGLLDKSKQQEEKKTSCFGRMGDYVCGMFTKQEQKARSIYLNGDAKPGEFTHNRLNNQKYTWLSFLPVVLFNQFKQFYNLFFLLICFSQAFPALRIGFLITYIGPLAFVLTVTLIKEMYDDCKRKARDAELNGEKYKKMMEDGSLVEIPSADIKVGDFLVLEEKKRVPADVVLLHTSEKNGTVFIKTDQLDGETDWKLRKAIPKTQEVGKVAQSNINKIKGYVKAEAPHRDIYKFLGTFYYQSEENSDDTLSSGLDLENTLWASTVLTMGTAIVLVTYTGADTKSQLNMRDPRTKAGKIDEEISIMSIFLFFVLMALSVVLVVMNGFHDDWYIVLMRFILLLSYIIPISLRVNLDLAKAYYSWLIATDDKIPETVARNTTIPEELGRVQILFSDKTGTLTQNEMEFKSFYIMSNKYDQKEMGDEIRETAKKMCEEGSGPLADLVTIGRRQGKAVKRKKNDLLRDLIYTLALCHNVTPVLSGEDKVEYQASSPDEIALVKFTEGMNYRLIDRDQGSITLKNPLGAEERFEILIDFPFTSESKRMGIILKDVKNDRIFFLLKGAETVIAQKVDGDSASKIKEAAESLSMDGLRTLAFASRLLTRIEYEEWREKYEQACAAEENRDELKQNARLELEVNLDYIGVTGVEDKLQENVDKTVDALKQAGIKVWMLTGDKIETACCIGISSGLKSRSEKYVFVRDLKDDKLIIEDALKKVEKEQCAILVIDGNSVEKCLKHCEKLFFESSMKVVGVLVCRCSPTQKTLMVKKMKFYSGMRVAGIGDGGNDVGMIQEADVGIGIEGKEGKQASLAADFSIKKFSNVARLFLWHGRLSYKRTATLGQFVIHRGLVVSVMQMLFSLIFYFCAIPVFNSYLLLGYATFYTFLPVFCLVFDQDIDDSNALAYPCLYKTLQKGRLLSFKTALVWTAQSLYQGFIVMTLAILFFPESFVNIVIINFSALIMIELLNLYTELNRPTWFIYLCLIVSFIIYVLTIYWFKEFFDLTSFNLTFVLRIVIIAGMAWLPIHIIKYFAEKFDPSEAAKVEK